MSLPCLPGLTMDRRVSTDACSMLSPTVLPIKTVQEVWIGQAMTKVNQMYTVFGNMRMMSMRWTRIERPIGIEPHLSLIWLG